MRERTFANRVLYDVSTRRGQEWPMSCGSCIVPLGLVGPADGPGGSWPESGSAGSQTVGAGHADCETLTPVAIDLCRVAYSVRPKFQRCIVGCYCCALEAICPSKLSAARLKAGHPASRDARSGSSQRIVWIELDGSRACGEGTVEIVGRLQNRVQVKIFRRRCRIAATTWSARAARSSSAGRVLPRISSVASGFARRRCDLSRC
jgi:hypothetical protein